MPTLTMNKVTYKYPKTQTPAVKDVSCEFKPGKLYAIMGPSGSGKSTLLSMLAGLDNPTGGEIRYDTHNIKEMDLDQYRREKVSMIFQAFQLFPLLTAIENVCYPMELTGTSTKEAKPKAEQLLQSVSINPEQTNRFPSNLSGGEQQRVAIARSLASGAKILLADEPTGNLDVTNSENIMAILTGLAHNSGYCVIVVTHDMEIAKAADVMFTMRDGVISISDG